MFVASLNLDLFFKKVFSNKRIAKRFLEDFLGVHITEITLLGTEHRLSDDSVIVKFDFRCKIRGKYVIIEMQQKYKTDVNKRFYLYHCVNTALQLENLEPITITKPNGETYTEKNYSGLEPVITLIWMVDDSLNFTEDFIVFTTLPEAAKDFIKDNVLWSKSFEDIKAEREKTIKILENKTKDLDFFSQNRLIYIFQKNIILNNIFSLYFKWFDFAQKSKNPNNVESDFVTFKKDKDMAEILKRLKKDTLSPEEFKYVSDYPQWEIYWAYQQKEIEQLKKKAELVEKKLHAEQEKLHAEQEKLHAEQEKLLKAIKAFLVMGKNIRDIADILELPIDEINALAKQIEDKQL